MLGSEAMNQREIVASGRRADDGAHRLVRIVIGRLRVKSECETRDGGGPKKVDQINPEGKEPP